MFVSPGSIRTTLAAPLATSVAVLTCDTDLGLAKRRRVINPVARHSSDMPYGLEILHDDIFVLGKYYSETSGTREQICLFFSSFFARGLQIGHPLNVGQAHAACDFTCDRQRIAGEHLHGDAVI